MDIGIAYYPEHWPVERWDADFALMAEAGVTVARMGEFAWCRMEPREGEFELDWLERAVELAAGHGIRSVLCTPTEAPPPWLSTNYPETRPWTPEGQPYAIGSRRHCDPASPAFIHFSDRITRQLGERFGRHRDVIGWQLDNEVGAHTHFVSTSPWMAAKFRNWLRERYGTVEQLNEAWGLAFWSGEVRQWSEIELQTTPPTGMNPAYRLALHRFGQQLWLDFLKRQAEILRPLCPDQFITHNIAWYGEQVDVWQLAEFLDVVGIDHYPRRAETLTAVGDLYHAVGRGKPWAVLEMGADEGRYATGEEAGPCRGWLTTALVKHALAGAKLASLFRFMPAPSGSEQYGGPGLRDEAGRPTASVQACARARQMIDQLQPVLKRPRAAEVAIIFDPDDLIFQELQPVSGHRRVRCNDYPRELFEIHHQLAQRGHRPTFASLNDDLSRYRAVIVWNKALIQPQQAEVLRKYVRGGGRLLAGHLLGYLTVDGRRTCAEMPHELTDVFGCAVSEMLRVQPGMAPRLEVDRQTVEPAHFGVTLEPRGATVWARWAGWRGEHDAAATAHDYGDGHAVFIGALLGREAWDAFMPRVMSALGLTTQNPLTPHPALECFPERGCWVAVNTTHETATTDITGRHRDVLDGHAVQDELTVPPWGMRLLEPVS